MKTFILALILVMNANVYGAEVCTVNAGAGIPMKYTASCTTKSESITVAGNLEDVVKSLMDQGYSQVVGNPFGILLIKPTANPPASATASGCPISYDYDEQTKECVYHPPYLK